jgi:hypothetical protein
MPPPLLITTPGLVIHGGETKSLLSGEKIIYPHITVELGGNLRNIDDEPIVNPIVEANISYAGTLGHTTGKCGTITVVGTLNNLGGGTIIGEFLTCQVPITPTVSGGGFSSYDPTLYFNENELEDFISDITVEAKDELPINLDDLESLEGLERLPDLELEKLEEANNYISEIEKDIREKVNGEVGVSQKVVLLYKEEKDLSKKIYDLSKMGLLESQLKNMREALYEIKEEREKMESVLYKIRKERLKMMELYDKIIEQKQHLGTQNIRQTKEMVRQRKEMVKAIKIQNVILFIVGAVVVGYIVYKLLNKK